MTRHVRQLFKVKRSKVKVTRSCDVSADKDAVTRQWMAISSSNLVGIINVRVGACGILCRSVKVKVKFSHTRYRALGPELIPVYRQSARR